MIPELLWAYYGQVIWQMTSQSSGTFSVPPFGKAFCKRASFQTETGLMQETLLLTDFTQAYNGISRWQESSIKFYLFILLFISHLSSIAPRAPRVMQPFTRSGPICPVHKMWTQYLGHVISKCPEWSQRRDFLWAICWSLGQKWQRILSISFSIQRSIVVGNWWCNGGITLGKLMMRTIALPIKGLLIFCVSNGFNIRAFLGQWRANVAS